MCRLSWFSGPGRWWRPTSRASSGSLKVCPWPSICFHGPSGKFLDLLPPASQPPVQKRDTQHMLLQHKSRTDFFRFFLASRGYFSKIGVSETGSAETGSAIDVRIDDAGSILNFRIGFSLWFSAVVNQLSPLVLEASRGSILNFRIGFLSSIGGRLPYPCLPTLFPILTLSAANSLINLVRRRLLN